MSLPPPPSLAPEQKRAAVRLRLMGQTVELWTLDEDLCGRQQAQIVNISEGGMAAEGAVRLPAGTQVQVRCQLAAQLALNTLAEVVRCEPSRHGQKMLLGLRFLGLPEPRRDHLVRWIFAVLASRRRA